MEVFTGVRREQTSWLGIVAGAIVIGILTSPATADLMTVLNIGAADYVNIGTNQTLVSEGDSQQASSYGVLWDTSHGVYRDYEPSGQFQPLVQNLASHGFSVDTTSQGFLVDDPASYDVIAVCTGSAWNSTYSPAEVARIASFVSSGGGLLIMGDIPARASANIQPVASVFGISLRLSDITPYDTYSSNLSSHAIFDDVSQIYMRAAGEISAVAPSSEMAWQEATGKALVTVGTYGNGRVVTLGDNNVWGKTKYYDLADNRRFSINTFEYLAVPEPTTLLLLGLGGLTVVRKRRTL